MNALEFRNNLVVITNDIVNVKVMILCKGFIYGKHWIVSTMLKEMEKVIKAFRDISMMDSIQTFMIHTLQSLTRKHFFKIFL